MFEDSFNLKGYGLIFFDAQERFRQANSQAREFLPFLRPEYPPKGKRPDTLREFLDYIFVHAVDCDESLQNALRKFSTHASPSRFREVIHFDNDKFCLVELQRTANGRLILVMLDVSATKKHEDKLVELSQYNYEVTQAVHAATNGIFIATAKAPDYPLLFTNKAFSDQIEAGHENLSGRSLTEILYKINHGHSIQTVLRCLEKGKVGDVEIKTTSGENFRWFNLKLTPVKSEQGQVNFVVGVFSETTALKIREAEFFHAQKLEALGQLAAGVAHDFNNVLSIIDGYARIAGNAVDDEESFENYLKKIRMATQRGASLTRKMLTFGRHKIVMDSVIDLTQTVLDQSTLIKPLVDASINIAFTPSSEHVCVECPVDTITQILMNLVINARDAMPQGGSLIIETRLCKKADMPSELRAAAVFDAYACLSVIDSGEGMDKELQARIFEPFFTTKEQGKGTGLGLSMVYGMVKELQGQIGVSSVLGAGTVMSIYLPLSDKMPHKVIKGSLQDISNINLQGYTVLLAEDEPAILELVGNMLDKLGMNVIRAANGNQALTLQQEYAGTIDLLLTDIVMPELGGVNLAEIVKSLRPDMKVIYFSGYPANNAIAKTQLPEGSYFMAKPMEYEALAGLIFQQLSNQDGSPDDLASMPRWEAGSGAQKKTKGTL